MSKKLKIIVSVAVILSIVSALAFSFNAVEIKRYYGDINNDSYVTIQDARIALLIAADIYEDDLTGMDFESADMDNDEEITVRDARLILRTSAGHIKKVYMEGYEFTENANLFLKKVNNMRLEQNYSNNPLKLSDDLCEAARIAAKEYAEKTGTIFVREDDSYYYKLLDEQGITYSVADKMIVMSSFGYKEAFDALIEDPQSKKALLSKHFEEFGVGAYTKDGHTFYWCVFLIKE